MIEILSKAVYIVPALMVGALVLVLLVPIAAGFARFLRGVKSRLENGEGPRSDQGPNQGER
jgi:hypothetical protein